MAKDGIDEPTLYLPILWYAHDELTAEIRLAYMGAVTLLWKENFSYPLGDWCRAHGVQYIGHLIEDMNAHARLGCSAGHYFRGLDGQDMSGIDIVLHQVMPGMADYKTAALVSGGMVDGEFFHYVLGQLAASHARQNPNMNGRAMCEVFGAYGWAEGANVMKWLMDFLLVRGVNHFVPHAFDDFFPDRDCPQRPAVCGLHAADALREPRGALSVRHRDGSLRRNFIPRGSRVDGQIKRHADAKACKSVL